jgi:Protein of unknown function (DUF3108)
MSIGSVSPRYLPAWPWRGIAWALVLALAMHMLAWRVLAKPSMFRFESTQSSLSLNTRVIDPVPATATPVAPLAVAAPRKAPRAQVAAPVPTPQPAAAQSPKIEQNQPQVQVNKAPAATETIAATMPEEPSLTAFAASTDATLSATASPQSAPSLSLSYPASAKLQFQATYMSKGQAQNGSGVLSWKIDGAGYELSLEASALVIFSRTEKSVGLLSSRGLAPQRYSSLRTGRSEQATHFRAEQGKIQFSNNRPDAELLPGAQDRISVMIQLAGLLGGPSDRNASIGSIQMQVAGLDNAELWDFKAEGLGQVQLPAGNLQTLKLSRSPRNEFDQRLEIWLAPQLSYLPVRIKLSSSANPDQDFTDLVLSKMP